MPSSRILLALGALLVAGGLVIGIALVGAPKEVAGVDAGSTIQVSTTTTVGSALPGSDEIRRGDLDEARAKLTAHLEDNPDDDAARYLLALTYERGGEWEGAIEVYEQALQLNPNDFEAAYRIGRILERQGDLDGAASRYEESLALNRDFTAARISLAEVYTEVDRFEDAADLYFEVIEDSPLGVHLDQVRVALAEVLRELGQTDNAVIQLQKALADNPANETAQRLLDEIESQAREGEESEAEVGGTTSTTGPDDSADPAF
ncbi:MAG: hypothetical protein Kow00129_11590 [Thermoleophilia bacterium]